MKSARIRRRNNAYKEGKEKGTGKYVGVASNHSYGNYRDPLQNHKFDDRLGSDKDGITVVGPSLQQNLIRAAHKLMLVGKHIGSKTIKSLRQSVGRAGRVSKANY